MGALYVFQSYGVGDGLGHAHFFAYAVDEAEVGFGEEDGEGDAGETAARAEVEDARAGAEADEFGNAEGVEDVVLVEVVDVLAGDDVDFGVPVLV